MSALLEAVTVTRRFGGTTAVDGVSLRVEGGRVVGLVGANGAGKTTLMRLLLGLLAPDGGRVRLLGAAPGRRARDRVGYVPQGLGLWGDLSVADHFDLVAGVHGLKPRAPADTQVLDAWHTPVAALPLGLRRRVAFAVALAHRPDVLVLDEPTSGVDPLGRARLWDAMREVAGHGAGVLVSTHHLAEAERCDEVVLLAGGRVVASGAPAELTAGVTTVEVVAGAWERAWEALEQAGVAVLPAGRALRVTGAGVDAVSGVLGRAGVEGEVAEVPATLEEVFLGATSAT